jgi:hypothetical protein
MKKFIIPLALLFACSVYANQEQENEARALISNDAYKASFELYSRVFESQLPEDIKSACDGLTTGENYENKSSIFIGASMGLVEGLNRGCADAYRASKVD